MKRIISLCCVALICVFSLAAPARADDLYDNYFFNVLDYTTPNNSGDNGIYGSNSLSATFNLPASFNRNYIDVVIETNLQNFTVTYNSDNFSTALTVAHIGYNLYRVYGSLPSVGGTYFRLDFNGTGSYVIFRSVNLSLNPLFHFDIEAYCDISSTDYNATIHYVPTDEINHRMFLSTEDAFDTNFTCYIWTADWKKFDFIDLQLFFEVFEITSVNAVFGSTNVPFDSSSYDGSAIDGNDFYLSLRLDVRELDRTVDDNPMIIVTGRLNTSIVNTIAFMNCSGFVVGTDINPLLYYFTMLKSWIDDQTSRIVAAVGGDTTPGNNFQSNVQQELDELDQAQVVMDSVTKPAIEDINVSVDQYVSQSDIQVLAQPLTVIFDSAIFSKVIIMSILLATVSYTLYGKK